MKTTPTGKIRAGAPVFYDATIWPNGIVYEPERNLVMAEKWRTGRLLRLDVYRVQNSECNGLNVIRGDEFPVIRALIGRTGSARIEQMAPAITEECTWALAAITLYRHERGWDNTEPASRTIHRDEGGTARTELIGSSSENSFESQPLEKSSNGPGDAEKTLALQPTLALQTAV
jgi:hypothetical protein